MARPGVREPLQARSELTRDGQALDVLHCGVDAHRKRCVTGCASNSGQTTDLSRRSCAWAFANGEAPGVISGRRLKIARQAPMGWPMVSARWKQGSPRPSRRGSGSTSHSKPLRQAGWCRRRRDSRAKCPARRRPTRGAREVCLGEHRVKALRLPQVLAWTVKVTDPAYEGPDPCAPRELRDRRFGAELSEVAKRQWLHRALLGERGLA